MRFTDTFSAVLWDPPATAGVLSGLSYIVILMRMNSSEVVIVNAITSNTNYPLPVIKYYTADVTAFSSHRSESVVTGQRIPGGEFKKAWSICITRSHINCQSHFLWKKAFCFVLFF